jgi:urea transporter/murein DD-endopeptidase MepM/ murein hydrolase activator NlpD
MSLLKPILKAYSGIFFLPSVRVGVALLLLTLIDPNIGLSGLIGVLSAYLFAHFLGFSKTFLSLDYYIYNPLLVGLGIGFLFKLSPLTVTLVVVSSILTFLLTLTLSSVLGYYLRLPVLSLPFVIVSTVVYLASYKYSNLFVYYLYPHGGSLWAIDIPLWVKGFLRSLGEVIFYPNPLVGLVIFLILLRFSPILAFLAAVGYYSGTLFEALLNGNFYTPFESLSAFNYLLVALSLGGVFLIPHPRSYLLALLGVLTAVPIVQAVEVFFQNYGIPVFALPFNTVVLLFIYALGILGYRYLTLRYLGTPERTLDYFIAYQNRFPSVGREVGLPFSGRWTVWQGFNDQWTHKGPWKYALDFVITDERGKTYKGDGYYLSDYYAYRKPVLSPVSGIVVEVVDGYPDNPPGEADKENNWGNYVLIQDWRGFYVLLCHFAQNSIKVKKGDRVEKGTLLGLCGNSGYSPQPHIHMHVQLLPKVGSPTVPFVIESYINSEGRFFDLAIPRKGEKVEAFYPDKVLSSKFNLLIDEEYTFTLSTAEGEKRVRLKVKMAPDGTFYLDEQGSKLYFGQKGGVFYCYSLEGESEVLKILFTTLSKLPLNLNRPIRWRDTIPLGVLIRFPFKNLLLFLASFYHRLLKVESHFSNRDNLRYRVEGKYLGKSFTGEVKISSKDKFVEEVSLEMEGKGYLLKRS